MSTESKGEAPEQGVSLTWAIWVCTEDKPETGLLRALLGPVPIGAAFDQAGKYMRDEGWGSVQVIRHRRWLP